jgi:hypothetical protein
MKRYFFLSLLLLFINLLYSSYAVKTARDYARKVSMLKKERERGLILRAEIERLINYPVVKNYAEDKGFSPVDWNRIKVVKR